MKSRMGFVSNSSSSSFAVLGDWVNFDAVVLPPPKGVRYVGFTGLTTEAESIVFITKKETIALLQRAKNREFSIEAVSPNFVCIFKAYMTSDDTLQAKDLPQDIDLQIYSFDMDQHSVAEEELEALYLEDA